MPCGMHDEGGESTPYSPASAVESAWPPLSLPVLCYKYGILRLSGPTAMVVPFPLCLGLDWSGL